MIRVIIESQSNPLFRGSESEQSYDQRGGLCHGSDGDLVVTARPFDPEYLRYWAGLGFRLPELVVAGDEDPITVLSERIARNPDLQRRIRQHVNGRGGRVEFFCVEEAEERLAAILELPVYSNLPFSRRFSSKPEFHRLATSIGLPLVRGSVCASVGEAKGYAVELLAHGGSALIKSERGTGGVKLASAACVHRIDEFDDSLGTIHSLGSEFIVEELIPEPRHEISLHWEMTHDGEYRFLGLYDQLTESYSYTGVAYPSLLDAETQQSLRSTLETRLIPALREHRYLGYGCVDVNVLPRQHWMDFNPRKGAVRYIHDSVLRLFPDDRTFFWHTCVQVGRSLTFTEIKARIGRMLKSNGKRGWMILLTNPGLFRYGEVDLTGISLRSREEAHDRFLEARDMLLRA